MKEYVKIDQVDNPDFPITDWNVTLINLWYYFEDPKNLNSEEIKFVINFVESCGLNINGEDLLEITLIPGLKNFVVNIIREYKGFKNKSR